MDPLHAQYAVLATWTALFAVFAAAHIATRRKARRRRQLHEIGSRLPKNPSARLSLINEWQSRGLLSVDEACTLLDTPLEQPDPAAWAHGAVTEKDIKTKEVK